MGIIFCAIVNERMQQCVERCEEMGDEQNVFRKDRRAEVNLFVVNETIGEMKKTGRRNILLSWTLKKPMIEFIEK